MLTPIRAIRKYRLQAARYKENLSHDVLSLCTIPQSSILSFLLPHLLPHSPFSHPTTACNLADPADQDQKPDSPSHSHYSHTAPDSPVLLALQCIHSH
jgi:hypothetical protein